MIFDNKSKVSVVDIGKSTIKESETKKVLGVTFDNTLSFIKHFQDLRKKSLQKFHALARPSNYIDPIKLKLLHGIQHLTNNIKLHITTVSHFTSDAYGYTMARIKRPYVGRY